MRVVLLKDKPERNVSVTLYSVNYGVGKKLLIVTLSTDMYENISKNSPDFYIIFGLNLKQIKMVSYIRFL